MIYIRIPPPYGGALQKSKIFDAGIKNNTVMKRF
jgi:hypothetical protein